MYAYLLRTVSFIVLVSSQLNVWCLQQDILFMVDTSEGYDTGDLDVVVDFIYNITDHLLIGADENFISILTFSSETVERFDLNDFQTKDGLLNATVSLKPLTSAGEADTFEALSYANSDSFTASHGMRENSTKLAILITNSWSTSATQTKFNAIFLKQNAEIYVIGIKSDQLEEKQDELTDISSDPDTHYYSYINLVSELCPLLSTFLPKLNAARNITSDFCNGSSAGADDASGFVLSTGILIAVVISPVAAVTFTIVTVCVVYKYKRHSLCRKSTNLDHSNGDASEEHLPTALSTPIPSVRGGQLPPLHTAGNLFSRRDSSGIPDRNFGAVRSPTEFTLATLKSYIKEPTSDLDIVDLTPDGSVQNHPIGNGHVGNGHIVSGYNRTISNLSHMGRNETDYSSNEGSTPTVSEEDKKSKSSAGSKRKYNMFKTCINKVDVEQDASCQIQDAEESQLT